MIHPVDYAPSQDFGDNPTASLPALHWIIQQFGNYQPDGHTGTDYPCPVGTPVRAVAAGTVLHAGWFGGTYADNPWWIAPGFAGYCYVVDHGHFIGVYGHCRDGGTLVHVGQRVTEGQILGPSGNTGASTGPHLHFEVLPDGYTLNSYMYGRIDPARLFAGITPQGTITPLEDELSAAEVDQIITALKAVGGSINENNEEKHVATRNLIVKQIKDTGGDIITGTQAQQDVSRQFLSDRIRETSPTEIAELVPAEIAQQVIDALAARITSGK